MTFESNVWDSALGESFLPSFSNSSLNLASSAAYHKIEKQANMSRNHIYTSYHISPFLDRLKSLT